MTKLVSSVSVVIPVYNNAPTLRQLINELHRVLEEISEKHELIFVDDGSKDESFQIIREAAKEQSQVRGIRFSRNFGQHSAICAGLELASLQWTVLMDADLEDDPRSLVSLFENGLENDRVAIILSEVIEGKKPRASSRLFHWLFGRLNRANRVSNVGTLRAFDTKVRNALLSFPERGIVYGPLMATIGFATAVVPVNRREIDGRESSYTFKQRYRLAVRAMLANTAIIGRLVLWLGVLIGLSTSTYFFIVLANFFLGGSQLPSGLTLIVLLVSATSGITLISLGLVSAYLMTILNEVQARPRYLVEEFIGIENRS